MRVRRVSHVQLAVHRLYPAPENKRLYPPVRPDDPEIQALAESIRKYGLKEPLVVSRDHFVLSGHRRLAALKLIGRKTCRCRVENIRWDRNPKRFFTLMREFNRQRVKDHSTVLREELLSTGPAEPFLALNDHRRTKAEIELTPMELGDVKERSPFATWRMPFINAVIEVVSDHRMYWPLSDRRVHYLLLNDPPSGVRRNDHSARYRNHPDEYARLTNLLTRLRIDGSIPFDAIGDETRPVTVWAVHKSPATFIRTQLKNFLTGYCRDHMQSQPNHIEIIVEKNTIYPIVMPVAGQYGIPVTSGRGFASLDPRHGIFERYEQSSKEKLVLLFVIDFDPDGEMIAQSFARSLRDDFKVWGDDIHAIKVALTHEQVLDYELPAGNPAKTTSSNYEGFIEKYPATWDEADGEYKSWELEALPPATLQQILIDAIDRVIDTEAFNNEVSAHKADGEFLGNTRREAHDALAKLNIVGDEDIPLG